MTTNNGSDGKKTVLLYDICVDGASTGISSAIEDAIYDAKKELENLKETPETLRRLQPQCDKLDYALAVGSGVLCGLFDVFFVGKPGETLFGNITDQWFENRVTDFASLCGWSGATENSSQSALRFLEQKFKVPYDQRGAGDAGSSVFNLTPSNHHFKSLAHNPSILGLFFSVLDQFANTSHFVSGGRLIALQEAEGDFLLKGNGVFGKFVCAFVNWFGHLVSDVSGSSSSKGRGMGIPSPLWSWINDIVAIKSTLNIPTGRLDRSVSELAIELYENGFDLRFQTAQAIPVLINDFIVRLIYMIRRMIKYYSKASEEPKSLRELVKSCEPFKNSTVKRMLTVAHGSFLAVDLGDALARSFIGTGGVFNAVEFFMRLNIAGVGRFAVSLYGEIKRSIDAVQIGQREAHFAARQKVIIENYINGLRTLSELYDDAELVNLIDDLRDGRYIRAFEKSVMLAEKRGVAQESVLHTKAEIDNYFTGGTKNEH